MIRVTLDNVLLFHKKIILQTGGDEGIRDIELIEGALNRAFATFDGNDLYPGIIEKICAITYGLIKNHGFVDGNKRTGVATMILLLKLNHIDVAFSQQELVELGLGVADGSLCGKDIKEWIKSHIRK